MSRSEPRGCHTGLTVGAVSRVRRRVEHDSSRRCAHTKNGGSQHRLTRGAIAVSGGDGGGDGPRATITPQACSPIRLDHSRPKPTIDASCLEDFSCSTLALRTIGASLSNAAGAASFAPRTTGAGEQPGRERPHLRTPDPGPRVGSGVAHVPTAGSRSRSKSADEVHTD